MLSLWADGAKSEYFYTALVNGKYDGDSMRRLRKTKIARELTRHNTANPNLTRHYRGGYNLKYMEIKNSHKDFEFPFTCSSLTFIT